MKMEEDLIIMAYGPIPNREPCVFFNYPAFLKIQRPYQEDLIEKQNVKMTYRSDLTAVCIKMAMRAGGFKVDNKNKNPNF